MTLKVYNSLSRKKEGFTPRRKGKVSMYVCGVTVYDDCHLGHARAYVSFDIIFRYLEYKGYKVKYIQNFTDIDDKIINRAREEIKKEKRADLKLKVREISQRYIKAYFSVMDKLNIKRASKYPKATENIKEIIKMVKALLDKGFAYEIGMKNNQNYSGSYKDVRNVG